MKEQIFIEELIKGKSQRQAYLIAFPHSSKWKERTIDVKASKLFLRDDIKTRYNELSKKLVKESEEETIMKAKEILQIYTRIARGEEEEEVFVHGGGFNPAIKKTKKACLKDRLKALERLDKILALEKNQEEENNIRDDGLSKQIDKIVGDSWSDYNDEE